MKTPLKLPRVGSSVLFAFALFAGRVGGAGAAEDVPFIVTPDQVALAMLEIANVGPNDSLIDLGSGDGASSSSPRSATARAASGSKLFRTWCARAGSMPSALALRSASRFASRTCSRPT